VTAGSGTLKYVPGKTTVFIGLFNDDLSTAYVYMTSNGKQGACDCFFIFLEKEEDVVACFNSLSQNLTGGTEENQEAPRSVAGI
jgi:hypothetical protein